MTHIEKNILNVQATPKLHRRIVLFARDIKMSHTVFSLPFALLAAFLAAAGDQRLPRGGAVGLVVVCVVFARTVAMAVNRWADARLDALNPRTLNRAIPSGQLGARFVLVTAGLSAAGFVATTAGFWLLYGNAYPLILSPFVLIWIGGYTFTKRFTWLCHLFLGSALALSPLAAAVAIQPRSLGTPGPYGLAVMVMCWVAGFDVIYALQDVRSDSETGVFSLPAKLGVGPALWISRGMHLLAVIALGVTWWLCPALGWGFAAGIVVVAGLLVLEHILIWGSGLHHIHLAFFTLNGVVSLVLGGLGIFDVIRSVSASRGAW